MITDDVAGAFLKFMDNIFYWFGNVDLCCDKLKKTCIVIRQKLAMFVLKMWD